MLATPSQANFGDMRPAATMISAGLADPRIKIEIQVTARKPGGMDKSQAIRRTLLNGSTFSPGRRTTERGPG
jgi:hypothetical protein